jgi:hypothetical protein
MTQQNNDRNNRQARMNDVKYGALHDFIYRENESSFQRITALPFEISTPYLRREKHASVGSEAASIGLAQVHCLCA